MASESHRQVEHDGPEELSDVDFKILEDLKHLYLRECDLHVDGKAVGQGAYADVFKGTLTHPDREPVTVAMKHLRFNMKADLKTLFEKEIYVWQKLKHKNILLLLGYAFDDRTGYPILVSDWMQNGSAWDFVNKPEQHGCDLKHLVTGIADGLAYLHSKEIVHSDVKSDNVLVTDSKDAVICDFGLTRMIAASRSLVKLSNTSDSTDRYTAHETLVYPDAYNTYSMATDVWAFGMTVYELLARQRPYKGLRPLQIVSAIEKLSLPRLPEVDPPLTSSETGRLLWEVCQRCWVPSPDERASMASIVLYLPSYDVVAEAGQESQITEDPIVVPSLDNEERPLGSTELPSSIPSTSDNGSSISSASEDEEDWLGPFRYELRRNQEARFSEILQQYESEYHRAAQRLDAWYPGRERSSDGTYRTAKEKLDHSFQALKRKTRHLLDEEERILIEKEREIRNFPLGVQVYSSEVAELIREQDELLKMYQAQAQHPTSENTIQAEPTSVSSDSAPHARWLHSALLTRLLSTQASSISQDRRGSSAAPQSTNLTEDFFTTRVQNQSRNARYTAWEPDTIFPSSSGIHEEPEELSNTGSDNDRERDADDAEGDENNESSSEDDATYSDDGLSLSGAFLLAAGRSFVSRIK